MIRDSDEDINETAKELELNLGGEGSRPSPHERARSNFEPDVIDELEASDNLEPLEEELDIIAEIGDIGGSDKFLEPVAIDDDETDFIPARIKSGVKKSKTKAEPKKVDPRDWDLDDELEDDLS